MMGAPCASSAPTKCTVWPRRRWKRTQMSAWMYSMMWPICSAPLAYGSAVVTNSSRCVMTQYCLVRRRRRRLRRVYQPVGFCPPPLPYACTLAYGLYFQTKPGRGSWRPACSGGMAMELEQVNAVLAGIIDPNTGTDLVSARAVRKAAVDGGTVRVLVELGYPAASQTGPLRARIVQDLQAAGAARVEVEVTWKIVAHTVQRGLKVMPNV